MIEDSARTRHPLGFTLVEAMLVVAIAGILAALAVPSLQGMLEQKRVTAEIERVTVALLEIRNYARTRIRCVEVVVSANQIVATPYEDGTANPNEPCQDPTVTIADDVKTYTFSPRISLSAFTAAELDGALWFDRSGGPFDPGDDTRLLDAAELVVTPQAGAARKVRVYPLTGTVRLLP